MDDPFLEKDFENSSAYDMVKICKYSLLALLLVGIFIVCKNFKITNTRQMRGKTISFV